MKLIDSLNYRKVIDSLNIVIFQYNKQSNKLNFSENYKKVLGIEEYIENFDDLYSYIDEEDIEYIKGFFSEIIKNNLEEAFLLEFVLVNDNEERINIECSGKGIIKDNEYIITGVCLDTTEKVCQENKLRIREKRYKRALEGSKDIMFYINLKDNHIILDDKISSLMGLEWKSEYNFTIEQWLDFVVSEEREVYKEKFYKLLNSKDNKYLNMEYRIRNKLGRILWINIKGKRILEDDGEYIYMVPSMMKQIEKRKK